MGDEAPSCWPCPAVALCPEFSARAWREIRSSPDVNPHGLLLASTGPILSGSAKAAAWPWAARPPASVDLAHHRWLILRRRCLAPDTARSSGAVLAVPVQDPPSTSATLPRLTEAPALRSGNALVMGRARRDVFPLASQYGPTTLDATRALEKDAAPTDPGALKRPRAHESIPAL